MKSCTRFAIAMLCLPFLLFGERAFSSTTLIAQPEFTQTREFIVRSPQPATELDLGLEGIKVFVFERAVSNRKLDLRVVTSELRKILRPSSLLWVTLKSLFPDSSLKPNLTIVIDDFSQFSGAKPLFASYFLREPVRLVGIDSSDIARAYWLPSLAHELTHAFLADSSVESWWEEGLAQLMEREVGGMQPELTLRTLSEVDQLPPLLDRRRPVASRQSYALSFLFAKYLKYSSGGWAAIRVATGLEPVKGGATESQTAGSSAGLGTMAKRLFEWRNTLKQNGADTSKRAVLGSDKMTASGILRFFYTALVLKSSTVEAYQIPKWNGSVGSVKGLNDVHLEPGQAVIAHLESLPSRLHRRVEVYRFLTNEDGQFEILPRNQFNASKGLFQIDDDKTLILNLTDHTLKVIE